MVDNVKIQLHVKYFQGVDDEHQNREEYNHFTNPLEAFEAAIELMRTDIVEGIQLTLDKERNT